MNARQPESGTCLGVLAKFPQPGTVKTRLAATVGDSRAAALHGAFLETSLRRFAGCADRTVLVFSPPEREAEFRQLAPPGWELRPQSKGDLGARMRQFLETAAAGARRTVLLGADSPNLPVEIIAQAFDVLNHRPLVLGPSDDGGFYLLGIAGGVPPLFSGIDWGTPRVWQQTLRQVTEWGLDHGELPPWYDVDDVDDLERLRSDLRGAGGGEPALAALRESIASILR